jgi:hypothetical protein
MVVLLSLDAGVGNPLIGTCDLEIVTDCHEPTAKLLVLSWEEETMAGGSMAVRARSLLRRLWKEVGS